MSPTIAVSAKTVELEPAAKALANQLGLPYAWDTTEDYDYALILTRDHLSLRKMGEKSLPIFVDFLGGKLTYRRQHTSLRNEALARALGLKHHLSPTIVDATAGMGSDSFILASLGFDVILLERSGITHALLENGIARAKENPHVKAIAERMHLIHADAIDWLEKTTDTINVIYCDPMFPERQKSALVKKEMRVFHDIVGEDMDCEALLAAALKKATNRVVVKRPKLAPAIAGPEPSFSLKGSSCRFDVYIILPI